MSTAADWTFSGYAKGALRRRNGGVLPLIVDRSVLSSIYKAKHFIDKKYNYE